MSDVIKQERGIVQFIIGFLLGVVVFGLIAAAATFYLQAHHYCASNRFSSGFSGCIPGLVYAILRVASLGPATMLPILSGSLNLPVLQLQLISGGVYGLLGGIVFVSDTRRSPTEIFLLIYVIATAVVAFLLMLLILSSS